MEQNPQVHAEEALPRPAEAVAQTDQPCSVRLQRSSQESTGFSPFQLIYGRSVRGPGTIPKELWTKEVNIPVDDTDGATVAVAGVIHQDVDPELGEVPDLEGYRQREGVRDMKLMSCPRINDVC